MTAPFRAPTPWSADRPETLVVCCSDGRWHAQQLEFVRAEISERPDLYAVPGGPAVVLATTSSYGEAKAFEEAMQLLAAHHDLDGLWLIAHEGCAYYRARYPTHDSPGLRRRQEDDLFRAKQFLENHWPRFAIRLIYASHAGDGVEFSTLVAPKSL